MINRDRSSQKNALRYVLPESRALAVIGCLDLVYTVYLLATGKAHEGNQLFATILDIYGPTGFVTAKALMLGIPLLVAELARKKHAYFVRNALRVCIVLYLLIYSLSLIR